MTRDSFLLSIMGTLRLGLLSLSMRRVKVSKMAAVTVTAAVKSDKEVYNPSFQSQPSGTGDGRAKEFKDTVSCELSLRPVWVT